MAIARVARWLWVHAGSPPGRFAEFWSKAERAIVAAQQQPQQSWNERAIAEAETRRLGCAPDKNLDGPSAA